MALVVAAGGSVHMQRPGFRFYPTDQELVAGFLSHKVHGHSDYLGADWSLSGDPIIPTVDLYEGEDAYPWRVCQRLACLHTMGPTEFYCFTPRRKKYGGCDFNNRSVGDYGTWHGSQKTTIKNGEVVVGYRVNLTFMIQPPRAATGAGARNGQSKKKKKMENTHWVMREYTLKKQGEEEEEEVHDMVLCRVRNQKKKLQIEKGEWKTPWWEKEQPQPLQEEEARGKKRKQRTRPAVMLFL